MNKYGRCGGKRGIICWKGRRLEGQISVVVVIVIVVVVVVVEVRKRKESEIKWGEGRGT